MGWALGYMLSLSNLIPGESVALVKAVNPKAWTALLVLFVLLLVVVLGFLFLGAFKKKKGSGSAQVI